MTLHDDRRRANSFGAAAAQYDRFRPTYPAALIADLVAQPGAAVLDVGAGTGIASKQLADAGADVIAVEPDPEMAAIAAAKGFPVDVATFEEWEPAGRTFDLVVFAQSFHWVEPASALAKVAALLNPGGRLALLWNRIVQDRPTLEEFDAAYAGIIADWRRPSEGIERSERLGILLDEAGFANERRAYGEDLHFGTGDWIDMVTTYSAVLTLEADARELLRSRLRECIGDDGVDATNDALAVVCALR